MVVDERADLGLEVLAQPQDQVFLLVGEGILEP
jgi:hypothetical protein